MAMSQTKLNKTVDVKKLPAGGATLVAGAGGGDGFGVGADGFFSSEGDAFKNKKPKSQQSKQHDKAEICLDQKMLNMNVDNTTDV